MRLVLLLILLISISTFAQKNVLIEVFTNSHCPVCVNAHNTLSDFYDNTTLDDRFIEINYHMSFPYSDDPLNLHNQEDSEWKNNQYGPFSYTPVIFFDGEKQPANSYDQWESVLLNKLEVQNEIEIGLLGLDISSMLGFDVTVRNLLDIEFNNLKLNMVIIEDIEYTGRNGISEHHGVMRQIVNKSQENFSLTPDGSKNFEYNTNYKSEWIKENISLVVFVQDENNNVLQVASTGYSDFLFTGVEDDFLPATFGLNQNYPNPFNPATTIEYSIPEVTYVSLKVYDITGKQVAVLAEGLKSAGEYKETFNADNLSSGIYFYELRTGENIATKKMMLLK